MARVERVNCEVFFVFFWQQLIIFYFTVRLGFGAVGKTGITAEENGGVYHDQGPL